MCGRRLSTRVSHRLKKGTFLAAAARCRDWKGCSEPQAGKICGAAMTKILIAEDNAVNRELLRELLEIRGYTVVEACDGEEALRMTEQTQPDLLLLDIGM